MSVFDAFNETVNEFFEKIYLENNEETLKNMADFENPAENTPRKWLVVVKHFEDNSGREFTFESEKAVEKGDMVLVKTKYGESMAKVKNAYEVTDNPELILFIANAIGVKNITGKVIDVYVKKDETK